MLLHGEPIRSLDQYRDQGGMAALEAALETEPDVVIDTVVESGLRGRGGAGFPAGLKWRSIAAGGPEVGERFVVANGAEGEPGTFKDRTILRHNPYAMLEGLLIAATTLGARRAFVALKASFSQEADRVTAAAAEMADWASGVQIELVRGPDEYLFGEEKALLEVIEGEDPLPRLFPPYIYGLFTTSPQVGWSAGRSLGDTNRAGSNPTLVNNIETLANVPGIVRDGPEVFREVGTEGSPGTIVCTVSGDTMRHGVGEFPMGTPLAEVIETLGGGMPPGRSVKYVLSGVSNPVIRADHLGTPLTYEAMASVGAGLGTGGFLVYDDRTDPLELAAAVSQFLSVESCGQCPACKIGTARITEVLSDTTGVVGPRTAAELAAQLASVSDSSRCFLPTQEQQLITSLLPDMQIEELRTPWRDLLITKIVDLVDDRVVLDQRQANKRPDWTYSDT